MAQQIKLKRSAIAGKVPSTGSLATGELAINTVDGKVYFKRDDDTIQTIVTTNAVITGSLNINGPVTASFFKGNGSAITGVVSSSYTATASYVNPLDQTVQVTGGISASQDSYFNLIKIGRPANQSAGNLTSLAIGHQTLGSNAIPNPGSIAIGYQALRNSTAGYLNVAVGNNALDSLTSGSSNTAVGHTALGALDNIGASEFNAWNSALGRYSLQTLNMGGYNAGLGAYAGYHLYSGSNNVLLGYRAGGTAQYSSDSVFIGTGAGPIGGLVTVSNKLYIHNTGSNQPLLYGEFDNQLLKVYGDLHVSESLTVTGSLNINGSITGSDVRIDQWGSVSASLSSISSQAAVVPTLQQVTTQGNTTTTSITAASFTGSLFGTASYATQALSASYALSASFALTASHAANFSISGDILNVNNINFNTGSSYTPVEGRLGWDSGEGTLQLGLEGGNVTYALGEQLLQYVYNAEATTLNKGEVVLVSGSQGNTIAVKRANNSGDPSSAGTLGFAAEAIAAGANGWVITEGPLRNLNTIGLVAGGLVFLGSTPGTYTQNAITAPSHSVRLGYVQRVHASVGSIFVKIDNGYELGELHDVVDTTTTASYGDLLVKQGNVWTNSRQLTGSYALTGSLTATGQFIGALDGNASTATTASYALKAESVGQLNQNVVINGNLEVFGTSSFTYVTSSELNVANSFISVNIFEPAERFGGLKVYDSGSLSHLATASLAWDSLHNHWVYQNVSGSIYTGGMLLSGPRNTGSLGDEPNLTKWFVPRSDGGDHLDDSQIFSSGSTTIITGSLTTTGKVNINTVDNFGSDPDKFLALTGTEVVYRTGAQLLSDIGGQTAGTFVQNAGSGGQAQYIMRYADSNSATTSSIFEDTSGRIGIRTITPRAGLDLSGSNAVINEHTFGRGNSTYLNTIAIGSGSLSTANTVEAGVFIGMNAGMRNTQGRNSVVIGNHAAYSGSNVRDSVIIGDYAGANFRPGNSLSSFQDVYIGRYSGYNLNGSSNTAIGHNTMVEQNQLSSAGAANNVAIGTYALYGDDFQGNENVGIGVDSLFQIQSGSENIAIGLQALVALKNASGNIGIGQKAFQDFDDNAAAAPTIGYTFNTGLGYNVGYALLSGSFNTFLGPYAGADYLTGSRNVVIGYDRATDLNNTQGNLVITAGGKRIIHSRDGVTTLSGSLALKGTTTVIQQGIFVTGFTSLTVASISTGSYEAAFLDYVLSNGTNKRAGTLTVVWTASDIEWNDASTLDLGSTVGAEFTPTLAGSNANIILAVPGGDWNVRGHLRYM